jgi:phosphoribosylanthranilate isomerase
MSRARVKICGVTSLRDICIAIEAGADAVGLVTDVPSSPRNLSIPRAKELMRAAQRSVEVVIVTVPKDLSHLQNIHKELCPSAIQLHAQDNLHREARGMLLRTRLIGAIQVGPRFTIDSVLEAADIFDEILLDSYVPSMNGGTGRTHSWEMSRRVRDVICTKPFILAGGLTPENVADAIRLVRPNAVDVSSGVESNPGIKDRGKVFEFIKSVKGVEF